MSDPSHTSDDGSPARTDRPASDVREVLRDELFKSVADLYFEPEGLDALGRSGKFGWSDAKLDFGAGLN